MPNHQLRDARAEEILARVRRRVRLETLLREQSGAGDADAARTDGTAAAPAGGAHDIAELVDQLRSLYERLERDLARDASKIGAAPPERSSLRGEIGNFAIGILRRLLWWYTMSLDNFTYSLRTHLQDTTELLGTMTSMLLSNEREIAMLREEVRLLRERQLDREGQAG